MSLERELSDMDSKIEELKQVVNALEGAVINEHIDKIQSVIEEWYDYTKKSMQQAIDALEAINQ